MKRILLVIVCVLGVSAALAARNLGFETDAFNRMFPLSYTKNVVFSPASFEIDCALIAESLATIPKANVSEMLGVVTDLPNTYGQIIESITASNNGFSFVAARGFVVSQIRKAQPALRQQLERDYGAKVVQAFPAYGATQWFRSMMEGEMEDFELPVAGDKDERYSFYDLVSVGISWRDSFPTANTRNLDFTLPSGEKVKQEYISDVRLADILENKKYTVLKLPLKGEANFYALLPKSNDSMEEVRSAISSATIHEIIAAFNSKSGGVEVDANCAIILPKFEVKSQHELVQALQYFRVPLKPLPNIADNASPRSYVQLTRFVLQENGANETALKEKDASMQVAVNANTRKLFFTHPFIFFVHHPETSTIPIAGQFTGVGAK